MKHLHILLFIIITYTNITTVNYVVFVIKYAKFIGLTQSEIIFLLLFNLY